MWILNFFAVAGFVLKALQSFGAFDIIDVFDTNVRPRASVRGGLFRVAARVGNWLRLVVHKIGKRDKAQRKSLGKAAHFLSLVYAPHFQERDDVVDFWGWLVHGALAVEAAYLLATAISGIIYPIVIRHVSKFAEKKRN